MHGLLFEELGMHAHHQNLLVVGPIEDSDVAPLGQVLHVTPQEVVVELLVRWLLEADYAATLRVHPRHDEFDGAVLAGRVHGLQND
jgi:hypothetical protein